MAQHKSAKKRVRQNEKKRIVNKTKTSEVRSTIKLVRSVISAGNKEEAVKLLPKTQSLLRRLAKSGVIKSNNASRRVSRLSSQISSM